MRRPLVAVESCPSTSAAFGKALRSAGHWVGGAFHVPSHGSPPMSRKPLGHQDLERHYCGVALVGSGVLSIICLGVLPIAIALFDAI